MVKMKWRNDLFRWNRNSRSAMITGWMVLCTVLSLVGTVRGQTYCEDKPKILYYRRGQAALVSGASDEVANHVVISNVKQEFLACVSSRNVEWVYAGEGEPSKFQESSTVDIQKYDDGSISYCLTSQVTFYNKQSDTELSRHTGRYICREIGNVSNSADVYLFASRKNSPTFLQSRKTLMHPLGAANITMIPERRGNTNGTVGNGSGSGPTENNKVAKNPVFTIPCVTTRPDVTAKLFKKARNNKFMPYTGVAHEFDPKYGFRVNASTANLEDLSDFYGEYKCKSSPTARRSGSGGAGGKSIEDSEGSHIDKEDFVLITLVKAKTFKVLPPVAEVYTSGMLNLTCESEEPVIMKEVLPPSAQDVYSYLDEDDYGRDRSDDIVETTERIEQKSHVANYMEIAPAPGRTGAIQCLSEKTGKVLHTWKYRIIRKRSDKLSGIKFNKREQSFTCKSKLGAPGRLSFVSCRTPSECRINKNCLLKSENCRGYSNSTRAFCERKTYFCGKIFYKGGSGLIRCIGEGIDEIRGFTDESVTDQAVRMGFGKLKASETALLQLAQADDGRLSDQGQKLQAGSNSAAAKPGFRNIYEGTPVNVTLRMGYYFFLYPVQWTVKLRNGSTMEITSDSQTLQVDRLTRTVLASVTLPYTSATKFNTNSTSGSANSTGDDDGSPQPSTNEKDSIPQLSEIVALNALIPLRSSVDPSWKTVSLPLTVYGKEGLQQPPADLESDEVLVEPPLHSQQPVHQSSSPANKSGDKNSTTGAAELELPSEDDNIDNEEEESDDDEDEEAQDEDQQEVKITASDTTNLASRQSTTTEPTKETVSIPLETSSPPGASKVNGLGELNPTQDDGGTSGNGKVGTQDEDVNLNKSISINDTASSPTVSSATSVPALADGIEGTVSQSPSLTFSVGNDDAQSHQEISGKAQEETLLARSGLLDDELTEDSVNPAQIETQHENQGQVTAAEAVEKAGDEVVPTTVLPRVSFSSDELTGGISSSNANEESDDPDQIHFTTEQPRGSRLASEIETTAS